jgi:hypothetical protein
MATAIKVVATLMLVVMQSTLKAQSQDMYYGSLEAAWENVDGSPIF